MSIKWCFVFVLLIERKHWQKEESRKLIKHIKDWEIILYVIGHTKRKTSTESGEETLLYHYGTQGFNETAAGQGCQELPEFCFVS